MMDLYLDGKLDEVYILFTKMVNSFQMEPTVHKLLPLDPDVFPEFEANRDSYNRDVTYVPSRPGGDEPPGAPAISKATSSAHWWSPTAPSKTPG